MGSTKTIKDVEEDSWSSFKSIAARNNIKMGKMFENMVNEYSQKSKEFWNDILGGEQILSDKEAEDIMKTINKSRKEYGFRK